MCMSYGIQRIIVATILLVGSLPTMSFTSVQSSTNTVRDHQEQQRLSMNNASPLRERHAFNDPYAPEPWASDSDRWLWGRAGSDEIRDGSPPPWRDSRFGH